MGLKLQVLNFSASPPFSFRFFFSNIKGDFLLGFFNQWQTSIENFEIEKFICKELFTNYVGMYSAFLPPSLP